MIGADTETLRQVAQLFDRHSATTQSVSTESTREVGAVVWVGDDADRFRQEWHSQVETMLAKLVEELAHRAGDLRQQADAQDTCSQGTGGASGPVVGTPANPNPAFGIGAAMLFALLQTPTGQAIKLGNDLFNLIAPPVSDLYERAKNGEFKAELFDKFGFVGTAGLTAGPLTPDFFGNKFDTERRKLGTRPDGTYGPMNDDSARTDANLALGGKFNLDVLRVEGKTPEWQNALGTTQAKLTGVIGAEAGGGLYGKHDPIKNEAELYGGLKAMATAKVQANIDHTFNENLAVGAVGEFHNGVGAEFVGGAKFKDGHFRLDGKIGLAWGYGFSAGFNVDYNYANVAKQAVEVADNFVPGTADALKTAGDYWSDKLTVARDYWAGQATAAGF